ncbi:MAG: hypothetical protein H0X64_03295 [Gemmatimonadaceae bacterium]|nr:hypothetical protein [Gemmatimonadaceae bacterium]
MTPLPCDPIYTAAILASLALLSSSAGAQRPEILPARAMVNTIGPVNGPVRFTIIRNETAIDSIHELTAARPWASPAADRCSPSRPVAIAIGAVGGAVGGYLIYRLLSFGGDGSGSSGVRNGFVIVIGTLGAIEGARGRLRPPGCPRD